MLIYYGFDCMLALIFHLLTVFKEEFYYLNINLMSLAQ